jgi:hypothetical protein
LDNVGSVRLEGNAGEGTFCMPVAAADIVGDVSDCRIVPVSGTLASGNGAQLCGVGRHGLYV